jgi:sulfane dehydrogenase subunit SoxC
VKRPLELWLDDLRARPAVTVPVTFECAGNGRALLSPRPVSMPWLSEAVGTAEWTGTSLRSLLEEAEPADDAVDVVFTALDHGVEGGIEQDYQRSLSMADALRDEVMVAYALNGAPLPWQHGFPLRLIVPGWYGMMNVKWLRSLTVIGEPFDGWMQAYAYHFRSEADEPGTPVTRMLPRSLMRPPGMPVFHDRSRVIRMGPARLEGRAWSGRGAIDRVEVSVDAGSSWADAEVGSAPGPFAWHSWSYLWDPDEPGVYEVCCRATDSAGNAQPLEPAWNLHGYANNVVQRVMVQVLGPGEQPA